MYWFAKPIYGIYTKRFMDVAWSAKKLEKWFLSDKPVIVVTKENAYLDIKDTFPCRSTPCCASGSTTATICLSLTVLHPLRHHRRIMVCHNRQKSYN
jgi:hypothetical protein